MGCNMAPGLHRSFAAEQWPWLPRQLWQRAREEAHDVIVKQPDLQIAGTDIDGQILKAARQNAAMAGVDEHIHFQQMPVSEVRSSRSYGVMICNPPYGERLSDRDEVVQIYRSLQEVMSPLETWSFYVLTAYPDFEQVVGRVADRRRKLYNGNIECQYYQFFGPRPPQQYFA